MTKITFKRIGTPQESRLTRQWQYVEGLSKYQYKDNEIDIFAFVSVPHRNVVFSKPIDKGQLTIIDEHMKNNDAVKNIQDILKDLQ